VRDGAAQRTFGNLEIPGKGPSLGIIPMPGTPPSSRAPTAGAATFCSRYHLFILLDKHIDVVYNGKC
jgi:hypothetical protein